MYWAFPLSYFKQARPLSEQAQKFAVLMSVF
jgi:hypothetical protein